MDPFCNLCFTSVFINTVSPVPCSLVITCLERADLLALLCVMFPCVIVTFPYGFSSRYGIWLYRFLIFVIFFVSWLHMGVLYTYWPTNITFKQYFQNRFRPNERKCSCKYTLKTSWIGWFIKPGVGDRIIHSYVQIRQSMRFGANFIKIIREIRKS